MGQRLGLAAALLGDPATVILDEPVNGLDPEGVQWVRQLVRGLAAEGRTVFLSSHLMSEMAQTADHIIVLGRGRIIADAPVREILAGASGDSVRVRSAQAAELEPLLRADGAVLSAVATEELAVEGVAPRRIAEIAAAAGLAIYELTPISGSLEDAYMALTRNDVYLGAVAYLVMIGLISLSLGALIRNTAGSIATSIALILAAPIAWRIVGGVTDATWTQNAEMLFPPNLGLALFSYPAEWAGDPALQTPTAEGLWTLEPWQGGLGLVVWVVVLFGAAAVAVKRRDA